MQTNKNQNKRNRPNDNDSDSDNEIFLNDSNFPRFLIMSSTSEDFPLTKLSPFAIQKAFIGIAGNGLKSTKRLRNGSFLIECVKKHQANNLLRTVKIVDRPVKVTIHKALNSSKGVIRCRELLDLTENEIRDELRTQGVVEVHRVTVKKGEVITPTNTLFLTFNRPDMPAEITVGYLKVKVSLFIPNPMRCYKCNKFGHTSQRCRLDKKCQWCGKDEHQGGCDGPKKCSNCSGPHASSDKECPVWIREKEIQRVRVEQRIPFPEARRVVERKSPTVVSASMSYSAVVSKPSKRSQSSSVGCQTELTWVSSSLPKSVDHSSFSFACQTTAVFPDCSLTSTEGSAATFKKPVSGTAPVQKAAKDSAGHSGIAPTGQVDPSKTSKGPADTLQKPKPASRARLKSGSPRKRSASQGACRVVVEGTSVRIDADGILDSGRFQMVKRTNRTPSPQMVTPDRKKGDDQGHLPLANKFDVLTQPDDMDTSSDKTN